MAHCHRAFDVPGRLAARVASVTRSTYCCVSITADSNDPITRKAVHMDQHDESFLTQESGDFWAEDRTRPLERLSARRRPAGEPPPRPSRPWQTRLHDQDHDDDTEFWVDDEFAPTAATPAGRALRSARHATADIATNARERFASLLPRRSYGAERMPNPAARRLTLLTLAFALLVPVALVLRGGDAEGANPADRGFTLAVGTAPGSGDASTVVTVEHVPPRQRSSSDATTTATPTTRVLPSLDDPVSAPAGQPPRVESSKQAAPATTAKPAPTCTKRYTIVSGDSWSRIADRVKVSMRDLLAANNATTSTLLLPGRTVCLPANATLPAPTPTTTKPTSTTVATPPASRPSYSAAQIQQIIRDVWPDELETRALEIAYRESRFNPYTSNWCCYGVFQINWNAHKGWLVNFGVTSASQLYDPHLNSRMALEIYRRSNGWGPWGG